ncbi:zinc ribbon domain-containing protein [Lentilitoribacter sp. EG35]|uniref:zinc ribbon domain-containing protein n=2 Tax=unclassified Lentilitoribacter TaxID=2647570 RepID=UPI00345F231A
MANCQSCGMPLNKDPKGGGTETDGTKSTTYCSLCYADGAFIYQDVTVEEFQAYCVEALKQKGVPSIMAWLFTRGIPKLERWKS